MQTLSNIKKDIEFNRGLSSLIEVLKNIAVSQFRTLEKKLKTYERFNLVINDFFGAINLQNIDHPFLQPKHKKQIIVAVTSDGGFLGGLNRQVVLNAVAELERVPGKLIIVGERGKIYAREAGIPFTAFSGINDEERYLQAAQLRDYIMARIAEDPIGYLTVIYPRPISFTVQRVEKASFLPYVPVAGKEAAKPGRTGDMIIESSPENILTYLLYLLIGHRLYEIFGLSRLAEFAARFVHLEESSQRLKEMDGKLRLQYFRVRHELIDRNMRELFSARALFTSKH